MMWLEQEIFNLLFGVAKMVVTKDMMVDWASEALKAYTATLLAQTKAARTAQSAPPPVAMPVVLPPPAQSVPAQMNAYDDKFKRMVINADRLPDASAVAKRILSGRARYQTASTMTGVPWWFIGILHYRESNCDFETYLGNGQSLHEQTTTVPKGRGPFRTFEDGCLDAMRYEHLDKITDWHVGAALFQMEEFNGEGYRNHGLPSPYVWGGSNQYSVGKYVADGVFSPTAVDTQLGGAVILRMLQTLVTQL